MKEINQLREEIKKRRNAKKLTQEALAEMAELSLGAIKQVEIGRNEPSVKTLIKIAKALGTTTDELLGLSEPTKDPLQRQKELADVLYGKPKDKEKVSQPIQVKTKVGAKNSDSILSSLSVGVELASLFLSLPKLRQEAILALLFDDESYMSDPEISHACGALLKAL